MRVLFVDGQHFPMPDANGNCVQKLRKQFYILGIESDVLTWQNGNSDSNKQEDEYGIIYAVSVFGKNSSLTKIVNYATGGRYVWEQGYSDWLCRPLKHLIKKICQERRYDWIISVSLPFCNHKLVSGIKGLGIKKALYNLDPYAFNEALTLRRRGKRLKDELRVYKDADLIFTSLEHRDNWESSELEKYMEKVIFVPYPNLEKYDGEIQEPPFEKDEDYREIVYVGALHDKVRYPEPLLRFFEVLLKKDPYWKLIIVGNVSGKLVTEQLDCARKKFGKNLVIHDAIPFPQAMGLIHRADLVANIENVMSNQMPSKLLDYIAAGKIIINFCVNYICTSEVYLKRYSRTIQVFANCKPEESTEHINKLLLYGNKDLTWKEIEKEMKGYTSKDVAKLFLRCLFPNCEKF